jgi:hypothetical protein
MTWRDLAGCAIVLLIVLALAGVVKRAIWPDPPWLAIDAAATDSAVPPVMQCVPAVPVPPPPVTKPNPLETRNFA